MGNRKKSEIYFEEIGNKFDLFMSEYDVSRRIALISNLLPVDSARKSALEVGCGTGRISEFLSSHVASLVVTDLSERLASDVGKRLGVKWRQGDACDLRGIADGSQELVVSSEVIEHTPDPRKAIAEMARIVRPGGYVIITSPNKLWYPVLWLSQLLGLRKFAGNEVWLLPGEAKRVLLQHGCTSVKIRGCHLFPWQIPLAKRVLPFFDTHFGTVVYPLMINYAIQGQKCEN